MRNQFLLLFGVFVTGCATQQPAVRTVNTPPVRYTASAALVFDPPITLNEPAIELSRATRGEAALVGYEQASVSYYDVYTDNRNGPGYGDGIIRESISDRIGSIQR